MRLLNTTTAISEPVSLEEGRDHLRVRHEDDDMYIRSLVIAARQAAESHCLCDIGQRTYDLLLDSFGTRIVLPVCPVISVVEINYIDEAGGSQTLAADQYRTQTNGRITTILPEYSVTWPKTQDGFEKVTVSFTSGIVKPDESIKSAIKVILKNLFDQRDSNEPSTGVIPVSAQCLLKDLVVFVNERR